MDYGIIKHKNVDALLNSSSIYYEGGGKTLNNIIYPVGAVIIRVDSTNPSTWYGGTWELLCPGRTLVCINTSDGDFNTVKKTGGEKNHTLTVEEMPSHNHLFGAWGNWSASGGNQNTIYAGSSVYPTSATGGNQPHNNLQPYMVVYMWVRTA